MAREPSRHNGKHGLNTVEGIINRWAPPSENKTSAYVRRRQNFGVRPGDVLNVREPETLDSSHVGDHPGTKGRSLPAETLRAGVDRALTGSLFFARAGDISPREDGNRRQPRA